jgi:hypothetical protein
VEAWMLALTAPFLNLSSIDIVEGTGECNAITS